MTKNLASLKKIIVPILKKNNVTKAGIFGSYARGDYTKKSDIDILIKFKGQKSLLDLVRLERELKTKIKKKIDVVTYNSLHPLLKEKILKEEVKLI